jgi:hypothetical protein
MVLVDLDHLTPDPLSDVAKLALLIGRRLISGGNTKVENRSAHGSALPIWQGQNAIDCIEKQHIFDTTDGHTKWRVWLAFAQHNSEGFFRTPQSFSRRVEFKALVEQCRTALRDRAEESD